MSASRLVPFSSPELSEPVTVARRLRASGIGDDDAVHDEQRLDLADQRRGAADLHLATASRRAVVHVDRGAHHLPCSALSSARTGTRVRSAALTDEMAVAALRFSIVVAAPVTITPSSSSTSFSSVKSRGLLLSGHARRDALVPDGACLHGHVTRRHPQAKIALLIGAHSDGLPENGDGRILQRRPPESVTLPVTSRVLLRHGGVSTDGEEQHGSCRDENPLTHETPRRMVEHPDGPDCTRTPPTAIRVARSGGRRDISWERRGGSWQGSGDKEALAKARCQPLRG